MKQIFTLLLSFFAFITFLQAQDSLHMTRLARWDDDTLPIASPGSLNLQYSGCWGMTVNGHEFAIIGGALHVLIFDITDPVHPQLVGKFAGNKKTIWREFKSYKNRLYAVSDGTTEGLMIFDMSQAPDTIVRTYWSNQFFANSHTITLDTVSGRIYLNGTNVANIVVLDISANPDQPTLLAASNLDGGYIHDSYVRGDTLYASSGNAGLYVYDLRTPTTPDFLAFVSTGGYNHNNWLTSDGRYCYYTEEIPQGQTIKIVDMQHLGQGDIEVVGGFLDHLTPNAGQLAIAHNIYIKDHYLFDSQYEDGLLMYDISTPTQPVLVAHYDTHPENTVYNTYYGCWGNYPWLPSGTIIATDMQNGLQLLRPTLPVATNEPGASVAMSVFPNPAHDALSVYSKESTGVVQLLDLQGKIIHGTVLSNGSQTIDLKSIPAGVYFLSLTSEHGTAVKKVVVE